MIKNRGTLFVLAAALLYSTGGLCMKLIPWSGLATNSGRSFIALVVFSIYFLIEHHPIRFNRWILLGAVCVGSTNILFSLANRITTAANSIVLEYTAPIFVILLSAVFLRRRPDRIDLVACIVVCMGVLCFFLESLGGGQVKGDLLALISGLTYAGIFLLNDMPDNDPMSSVFWSVAFGAVVGLPELLAQPRLDGVGLASMIFLGAFQMGAAYLCLTTGLKTTSPITASLVSGIEPVMNPVLVAVFYGEHMGRLSLLGAFIVIAGVGGYNVIKEMERKPVPVADGRDKNKILKENES